MRSIAPLEQRGDALPHADAHRGQPAPPAAAPPTMRTIAFSPSASARSSLMTSTAAAPSFSPDELPAVTVPPFRKTGGSFASASNDVSGRGPSSRLRITVGLDLLEAIS